MPRVLIADKLESSGVDLLKAAGLEVETRLGLKGEELAAALREFDAAIVRSQPKVTADCLATPGRLRAIARAGVGVDNIDVPAATRQGVVVMNTPGGNTVSAAEHTITLMLAAARKVPAADAVMKAGGWDRNKFVGTQVAGKTLGVVGLGRIGTAAALRAKALGMDVAFYDPHKQDGYDKALGVRRVEKLDDLLRQAFVLSVHCPLTPETRNIVDARAISLMPDGSFLVNTARGATVDATAVPPAIRSGK
ncbi:MAG: phosphoglycerate dehydrogenase, partial [Gemmataceae bacterium]|nr:phosphoglycerate dehydrogenase [Gemmataceae bacterium]